MRNLQREIALRLILEQIINAPYSLERREFDGLSDSESECIEMEMRKIQEQFQKRYNI